MQIWRPNAEEIFLPLTVDTTQITVDSTLITVDATVYPTGFHHMVRFIPRFTSLTHKLYLKYEDKADSEKILITPHYFQYRGQEISIYFNFDFVEGDRMEITLLDGNDRLMRREKGYATDFDDLENYSPYKKNNDDDIITMY